MLICGNGGSASDSDHIAGELLKGVWLQGPLSLEERNKYGDEISDNLQGSLPVIPLPNFNGLITAYSNDVNADFIYAQLVHGLGNVGDVFLGLSTSGNSKNVIHALKVAKAKGLFCIGLTGKTGGLMKDYCDLAICAPEEEVFKNSRITFTYLSRIMSGGGRKNV